VSRNYQVFSEEFIEDKDLTDIIKDLNGYKNDIGDFTIQNKDASVWISYSGKGLDKDYYQEEIEEVLLNHDIKIKRVITIELSSDDNCELIVNEFYMRLRKKYTKLILMNQDGEYFTSA